MSNAEAIVFTAKGVDGKDKSNWEYVAVPLYDIFDKQHQGASINGFKFERGKTYFMPPDFAGELRRILAVMQKADIRILQSSPDMKSVQESLGSATPGAAFVRGN